MSIKCTLSFLLVMYFLNLSAYQYNSNLGFEVSFDEMKQGFHFENEKKQSHKKQDFSQAEIRQDPYRKFDRLTKKNGLSSNYITDIIQDKFGFIWIATIEGLNRYDGHKIKQYRNVVDDSTSITDDLITCIKEDSSGSLWIGTRKGLNKYNRNNDSFEPIVIKNEKGVNSIISEHIRAILPDGNNLLWIETAQGDLIKYNSVLQISNTYHHKPPSMVNTYFYHDLYKDKNGILWLGGRFMGIYSFNPDTELFYEYKADEHDKTKKRENDIAAYYSDSQNNMWLAGIDGLYTLKTETEIVTRVLPVSTFSITEDSDNNIWFGTGAGLYIYSFSDNSFTLMKRNDNNPHSLIHNHINKIYIDNAHNVWIGTISGLSIFRPSKNKFKHIYHIPGEYQTPSSSNITALIQLHSGEIWIGTESEGIDCLDQHFIKTKNINSSGGGKAKLNSNRISVLMQDSEGDVWAEQWSGRGFNVINPNTSSVKSFSFLDNSLKADWYNDIFEDSKGNYWIGLWGAHGLYQFDKELGIFTDDTYQLKHNIPVGPVKNLVFDGKDLWIGLPNQSIFYTLNPQTNLIKSYLKNKYSSFDFNRVIDIYKKDKGDVWFYTDKGNYQKQATPYVSVVKVKNYKGKQIHKNSESILLSNEYQIDTILCEMNIGNNEKWFGTYKGIFRIKKDEAIQHFSRQFNDELISDTIWSMAFVSPENLWLGTDKGLCKFEINTEKFEALIIDENNYLSSHLIKCIAEDTNGNIWVGTTNTGLNKLDPLTQKVKQYTSDLLDKHSFWGELVNCIYVDKSGNIWIGGHGLNKYNQTTDTFSHYTITEGLADNNVMRILEDDMGKLWMSTLNGLSLFDPEKETFQNYFEKDGLQDNEFSNAAVKLKSGELAFGGKMGITVCNPQHLFLNTEPPEISIISFSVFDKKQDLRPSYKTTVELNYDENYFSFEFTALEFSNPEYVRYAYKLENGEKDWNYVDAANRIAKYTNIDPGSYRFIVRASNGDGIWNDKGEFVNIIIKSPYWKTTWFIILEVIFLLMIIVVVIKYRENKIIKKNQYQLLEQKLLRSQMNPHFIFNSLSSIQSFIFENNPLEAGSYLSRFAELIRSILYNSREEFITIEKEVKTLQNYLELQQLRYDKKFDYVLDVDPLIQGDLIQIPPMLAQPFIENAIEHGIIHMKGKGLITVSYTLMHEWDAVLLIVRDNGIGLKASKKLKHEKPNRHISLATVIARERIDIFNEGKRKKKYIMEIDEIKDHSDKTQGTKVKFIIPYREL